MDSTAPHFIPSSKEPKFFMPHFPVFTGNTKPMDNKNVIAILTKLNNPQNKLKNVIHIVGTNGKGSTCAFLKSILMEEGFTVNTYTSPHLYACNERININGADISDENLFYFTEKIKHICIEEGIELTIFESLTIVAILAFEKFGGDFNIFEAGMGGTNDATNVFDENILGVILTSISIDHTRFLGSTLPEIAIHKLGVIKPFKPVIMHPFSGEILPVILSEIAKTKAYPIFFGRDWNFGKAELENGELKIVFQYQEEEQILLEMPRLMGEHQLYNLCGVIAFFCASGLNLNIEAINKGIQKTRWVGRLERVVEKKFLDYLSPESEIWFDGAHNEGGALALANWLNGQKEMLNILVISKTKNTDVKNFILPFKGLVEFGIAIDSRGEVYPESTKILQEGFAFNDIKSFAGTSFIHALEIIKANCNAKVRIVICGSLYLAREISFCL